MRTSTVCLGEAMVVLRPVDGSLVESDLLRRSVGGAEANVAGGLAGFGLASTFATRLGDDPFGDVVAADLTARGVAVVADRDPSRPTGLYLKDHDSRMHYHRSGSAAAAADAALLAIPAVADALAGATLVHTSGITAGVLDPASRLLPRLLALRDDLGFVLSVDLNWRPALWRDRDPQPLLDLLRAADVVLAGADEAEAAFGVRDAASLRALVGPRPRLVVKSDAHEAVEHAPDGSSVAVSALTLDVVEPVGAGDGFAAGYLAGVATGLDPVSRLRQGHLAAACVLSVADDHAPMPSTALRQRLLNCSPSAWAAHSWERA